MLRSMTVALILLALAGCGVRGFKKDGATQQDFDRDLSQCYVSIPVKNCYAIPVVACQRDPLRNACMADKGWRITREDGKFRASW